MRPQEVYDTKVFENLMPLYFPRSPAEEHDRRRARPRAPLMHTLPSCEGTQAHTPLMWVGLCRIPVW